MYPKVLYIVLNYFITYTLSSLRHDIKLIIVNYSNNIIHKTRK